MPAAIRATYLSFAALLLVGGGFIAGRTTAPSPHDAGAECKDARQMVTASLTEAKAAHDAEAGTGQEEARLAAYAILQNPGCFDAKTRATAQSVIDSQDQAAMSGLTDEIRQCVEDATDDYSWSNC
ncbi:hypothetical protein [Streptomyces sp. NPDC018833]|uniref:hypothetical protein n=1 Tax=Streptomyces sp. NPDC018833 TaxID=3365053 RepID=UPI003791C73D